MTNKIKYFSFFLEIVPISLFFIIYSIYDIYIAAVISALASLMILIFSKVFEKRISYFAIFSLTVAIIFTILSILLQNPILIKIQPTIFNGLFSIALIGGLFFNRPIMKDFFSYQFNLNFTTWKKLSNIDEKFIKKGLQWSLQEICKPYNTSAAMFSWIPSFTNDNIIPKESYFCSEFTAMVLIHMAYLKPMSVTDCTPNSLWNIINAREICLENKKEEESKETFVDTLFNTKKII